MKTVLYAALIALFLSPLACGEQPRQGTSSNLPTADSPAPPEAGASATPTPAGTEAASMDPTEGLGTSQDTQAAVSPTADAVSADPAGEAEIAWGDAERGIQAGLSVNSTRFAVGDNVQASVYLRNIGDEGHSIHRSGTPRAGHSKNSGWVMFIRPVDGGQPQHVDLYESFDLAKYGPTAGIIDFDPQTTHMVSEFSIPASRFQDNPERTDQPGRYIINAHFGARVPAKYSNKYRYWRGQVNTGEVEIEIAPASNSEAVPDRSNSLEAQGIPVELLMAYHTRNRRKSTVFVFRRSALRQSHAPRLHFNDQELYGFLLEENDSSQFYRDFIARHPDFPILAPGMPEYPDDDNLTPIAEKALNEAPGLQRYLLLLHDQGRRLTNRIIEWQEVAE